MLAALISVLFISISPSSPVIVVSVVVVVIVVVAVVPRRGC